MLVVNSDNQGSADCYFHGVKITGYGATTVTIYTPKYDDFRVICNRVELDEKLHQMLSLQKKSLFSSHLD